MLSLHFVGKYFPSINHKIEYSPLQAWRMSPTCCPAVGCCFRAPQPSQLLQQAPHTPGHHYHYHDGDQHHGLLIMMVINIMVILVIWDYLSHLASLWQQSKGLRSPRQTAILARYVGCKNKPSHSKDNLQIKLVNIRHTAILAKYNPTS